MSDQDDHSASGHLSRAVDEHGHTTRRYVIVQRRILGHLPPPQRRRPSPLLMLAAVLTLILPALWVGAGAVTAVKLGTATATAPDDAGPVVSGALYVSTTGSDSNSGTVSSPFATIAKARDVVRTLTGAMGSDITVYLRGGVYRQTSTLALTSADSGLNGHNVIYAAYPGERPVISAGVPVTGWTLHDAGLNIWQASASGLVTRGFFVNGQKAIRARTSGDFPSGYSAGSSSITTPISTWTNRNKIEAADWTDSHFYRCRASGGSGTSLTMVTPCWTNARADEQPFGNVGFVENAYQLLDSPGEWYNDETAGIMYYKPRVGETLVSGTVGYAAGIDTVLSGTNVSHVQFSGLTFAYTSFSDPSNSTGYIGWQQGHYINSSGADVMPPAALNFTGSSNLTFDRNVIAYTGAVGASFDLGSKANTLTGNVFDTVGNNAINLGNYNTEKPASSLETRNFTIANNYFHNIGDDLYNSAAIWGGYVADIRIEHNEVYNTPQKGIAIGWGWGAESYASDNKVRYNYIHDTTTKLQDSGAMYALSPQTGTEFAYNYADNDVHRSNCLYPDEGSAFQTWHDNACSRVGQWLHIWIDTIHNLTVSNNCADTTTNENEGVSITMSGNTFISSGSAWPTRCQAIISGAGIQSTYTSIKSTALIP